MAFILEIVETFQRFQPLSEVLALSPDGRDSNRLGGDCSLNHLSVGWVHRKDALRRRAGGIIVYVLRGAKSVPDGLKLAEEMSLIYAVRKCLRIAEEQGFILVKLEVGNKAKVGPEVWDPLANVIFEGAFNMSNLLQTGEVVWRGRPRESLT
jgi:hypothetical protein